MKELQLNGEHSKYKKLGIIVCIRTKMLKKPFIFG